MVALVPVCPETATDALPIAMTVGTFACGWSRHIGVFMFALRRMPLACIARLLLKTRVFLPQVSRLIPTIFVPATVAFVAPTRRTAATPRSPSVVILIPASSSHVRLAVRRWRASPAVMSGEQLTGLGNGDDCARPLPGPARSAVPRWLRRDVDAGHGADEMAGVQRRRPGRGGQEGGGGARAELKARQSHTDPL